MADQPIGFSGQGFSLRGEKNRLTLPSAFRNTVKESSGGERILCIAKHDRWACLTGFGLSRADTFEDQLLREEERALRLGKEFDYDVRVHQLWGFERLPFDSSGRFVLPEHLAELGKLGDAVYFQGAGGYFTLWNPEELARMGEGWEGAQAACRQLASEAQAKAKKK